MRDDKYLSRLSRQRKRRNHNRLYTLIISIILILIVILISLTVINIIEKTKTLKTTGDNGEKSEQLQNNENDDLKDTENNNSNQQEEEHEAVNEKSGDNDEHASLPENEDSTDDKSNTSDTGNNNEVDEDDEYASEFDEISINTEDNIIESFTGNWAPIGTTQTNRKGLNFQEGSADRNEIKRAVSFVTGIDEENMIEYWYQNGGDQNTAISNVYDKVSKEYYTVYLRFIDGKGWQVRKVEQIKQYKKSN